MIADNRSNVAHQPAADFILAAQFEYTQDINFPTILTHVNSINS